MHRCLQRHGVSRRPDIEGDKPSKTRFKSSPIGVFPIDLAEVRTADGKPHLYVAIDRTSAFAFVRLEMKADIATAPAFLDALVEAVPYRVHTALTDNGVQFADLPKNRDGPTARFRGRPFDRARHGVERRLTKPNPPWLNGQVGRMNRTIKDATVKRFHDETHDQPCSHLQAFVDAYNVARRLKTLRGLTPYEHICKAWTDQPDRVVQNTIHQLSGPYT